MVRAWAADIRSLLEEDCCRKYYEALPSFRQEKADQIKRTLNRAQSVGVWALWEKIKKAYRLPQNSVFNFSHSGFWVMCAAEMEGNTKVQVGCDIEQMRKADLQMARRFFCPSEYKQILEAVSKEEEDTVFCRYWVLKERFPTATGKGMGLALNAFEIALDEPPRLIKKPAAFHQPYYYREYEIEGEAYRLAVCSTQEEIDSKIHTEFRL